MLDEKINHFHAPEISLEILFAVRSQKITQRRRGVGAVCDSLQKLWCWLRDAVIAQQGFSQRCWLAFQPRNLFIAGGAERPNNSIHEIRIIRWIYADRIAHLEAQSPPGEIELEMTRVLLRFQPTQPAVDQHCGRERVRPRIRRGGNSEASFS